jgi:hypothetical protein
MPTREEVDVQVASEFAQKRADLKQWHKDEESRLNKEYEAAATEAMKAKDWDKEKQLKDELRKKIDAHTAEYGPRETALFQEEAARKRELLGE